VHRGKLESAKLLADGVATDAGPDAYLASHIMMLADALKLTIEALLHSDTGNEFPKAGDFVFGDQDDNREFATHRCMCSHCRQIKTQNQITARFWPDGGGVVRYCHVCWGKLEENNGDHTAMA